ncbi:hypothetical protein BGZ97_012606 [Linnemannia gamsii]|uniref:Endoplasmic reticulum transmembrane protein n=1 Tax=Linnemannia gamsii TaxID=64522 RepID=A0A9P6R547_9FUNG|nr:hypothetical protein BGZ97_012606 [Linnemannia gamsii]
MSLPYTMVFTLLMTEMITFIFLILPLPFNWRRGMLNFLSKSPFMANIQYVMKIVFIFVFILFIDSLNRVIKVEEVQNENTIHHPHTESTVAARRFYAQRNMYLTGFTLFLSLILNRTFFMILDLLKSEEKMEIVKKQAAQQSKEYQRVLESESNLKKELKDLAEIVASHEPTRRDLENLKKQASQQQQEYLRMADENTAMEKKLRGIKSENKKDI